MKKKISIVLVLALGLATEVANADFTFGTPTNLGPMVNSSSNDAGPCLSADGLTLYFSSNRPGGSGGYDIWLATRATTNDDWGPALNLGQPPNSQYSYWEPSISSDGLTIYFSDGHTPQFGNRLPGGLGGQGDIWMVTRPTVEDSWSEPVNLGPAINSEHANHPSISADGLSLYFQSHRPGNLGGHCDIMVATRESTSNTFGAPVFLENVNTSGGDWMPDISPDGLTLLLCRVLQVYHLEIWMATRRAVDHSFAAPTKLPPQINVPFRINASPHLSADGSTLYFMSDRLGGLGGYDLWQVSITPVVDFNRDEIVDIDDLVIMIDNWGTDETLCDIGPMPWGDGVIDEADLKVLMSYWGQPVDDPTLIAHWALDEAEGDIAFDSGGENDADVFGGALWQPEGGIIDGAIELDGIDDYISTPFVLNPANAGPFSVFAWINGSIPGQAVISQVDGVDWLSADPSEGNLMTELQGAGRGAAALLSQTVITDGQWHRVGLVWDGSQRTLYVDGLAVAEDTQDSLEGSTGGLYIGAGKALEAGSFFSGLIDDVRIYNRAVTP